MDISLPLSWGIFSWRDAVEICFFSYVFYRISLWLTEDTQKNLLPSFYGFCMLFCSANFLSLTTVSQLLFIFTPTIIVLFMFLHQSTLQRNFISLKNITQTTPTADWLTVLMQTCLTMLHNNKELLVLIEHTDAIGPYLKADYAIHASMNKDLFALIMEKMSTSKKMIWINSDGTVRGVNVCWKASWYPDSYADETAWIDDAIAHTSKNDVLLLHVNPVKQYFTIAMNGTIHQELTIEQAGQLIRKKINYQIPVTKKGSPYDVTNKKDNVAQHIP